MRAALCLFLLLPLLSGCSSSASGAHPRDPSLLRWGVGGVVDLPTLDPALVPDPTSISVASLIYGGLVRLDSHLRVRPDGAQRWTISPDGTIYTFYLRRNLRFPDGTYVKASDFAAALQRSIGPQVSAGTGSFYLSLIKRGRSGKTATGITVVNSMTLRIKLTRPAAHFLSELAFPAAFVPDLRLTQQYGANWTDHAAGFGPFSVKVWRHSRYLTLGRNPYYYGGKSVFKTITLHFYQLQASAVSAYSRGQLDVVSGLQAGQRVAHPPTGTKKVAGLALDYLAFNTTRFPFRRVNARRAFGAAWSSRILTNTMDGSAFAATSFLPDPFGIAVAPWKPKISPEQYLRKGHFSGPKRFPSVTLVMPRDPQVYALARALTTEWGNRLGITVPIRQLNPSDYAAVLNSRAYDLAIVRWGGAYPDPEDFLATQLGSSKENVTGWTLRQYQADVLLADSYSPLDTRRTELFRRAAQLAAAKLPLMPLDIPAVDAVISPDLRDVSLTPMGTIVGSWTKARFIS